MSENETSEPKNRTTKLVIIFLLAVLVGCAVACGLLALLGILTAMLVGLFRYLRWL